MDQGENISQKGSTTNPPVSCNKGMVRLDAELGIVALDEYSGTLLDLPPVSLLGQRLDTVVDLGNLRNLILNGISFSSQVVLIGNRRIACDYVPIVEDDHIAGGALTLLRLLPEESADPADELNEILRSANAFMNFDHDGIIVVDRNGIIVLVNQSFAQLFDSTPQSMIGRHVDQAYVNSQPSRLPIVMETGRPEIGITHYFNGKQVYASRFPLIKNGKVIGCMGKILFRDVREITLVANQLQAALAEKTPITTATRETLFKYDINSIIGQSKKIVNLKENLQRVAQKSSNVLLRGESGTGKELFAHAIHAASNRRYAPFVKVNCAAIPENLLESELFGYAEGAFTGAKKGGQIGKFEQAHTGTIFLDEIGDMPLYMQAKMLRVLQEKELTLLGNTQTKTIDVRVVAATNSGLEQLVKEGKFREDLYYRLNVVTLFIPPLRERMEDIKAITKHFINQFNTEFGLTIQGLDGEAWDIISHYDWPGNIRELRNVIESAFNVVNGPLIMREHLPEQFSDLFPQTAPQGDRSAAHGVDDYIRTSLGKKSISQMIEDFEKIIIDKAVATCNGNKLLAAQLLGISRQGLYKKLRKSTDSDADCS